MSSRIAQAEANDFHAVENGAVSASSPSSSVASPAGASSAASSSSTASSWGFRRALSAVRDTVAAVQQKRAEAAAADRLAGETKLWSTAKEGYLASLTKHFHPVRHVEVAIRPMEIRLAHFHM